MLSSYVICYLAFSPFAQLHYFSVTLIFLLFDPPVPECKFYTSRALARLTCKSFKPQILAFLFLMLWHSVGIPSASEPQRDQYARPVLSWQLIATTKGKEMIKINHSGRQGVTVRKAAAPQKWSWDPLRVTGSNRSTCNDGKKQVSSPLVTCDSAVHSRLSGLPVVPVCWHSWGVGIFLICVPAPKASWEHSGSRLSWVAAISSDYWLQ